MLTREELTRLLSYDPETGVFRWRVHRQCVRAGTVAGSKLRKGYVGIRVNGRLYLAHVLAWFYMTGHMPKWPIEQVDHENIDRADCRWRNLRLATHADNIRNNKGYRTRINSKYKGVYRLDFRHRTRPWRSLIAVDGKLRHLGTFATEEEAHAAYMKAARECFGEFARGA